MGFELQHVQLHGHNLGYRMTAVHGIAGSSAAWREVMPRLAGQYTVIAPDLLGHGQSAKPTGDYSLGAYANVLRDLLGIVGIPRATVVIFTRNRRHQTRNPSVIKREFSL